MVDDVLWLGYAKVMLTSDNEPTIVKLLKEALATLKVSGVDQVGEEHSPSFDSQANGSVENDVNTCQMQNDNLQAMSGTSHWQANSTETPHHELAGTPCSSNPSISIKRR